MDKPGFITVKGSREFNRAYLRPTVRFMLCGAKLSNVDGYPDASDAPDSLRNLERLQGREEPSDGSMIPINNVSGTSYGDGNFAARVSILIDRNSVKDDSFERFHEIGIYAQICQNNPPEYDSGRQYRFGDVVVNPADGGLFRSLKPANGAALAAGEAWLRLPRPAAEQTLTHQRWYPIPGEEGDPFLFYVVSKRAHPICLDNQTAIKYTLDIELREEQADAIYLPPEDAHGFPEVQLAYLENISQAMRAARNEQRIAEVAVKSLQGEFVADKAYSRGDVVKKDGRLWIMVNSTNWSGNQLLKSLKRFPDPNNAQVEWVGTSNPTAVISWVHLSREIINLIDTWDGTLDGKLYPGGRIVVWRGRLFYRCKTSTASNPEPGTNSAIWKEFKIGRGT